MKKRSWQGDNLTCEICGHVLKTREPVAAPEDLFAEQPQLTPCSEASLCKNSKEECDEETRLAKYRSCYEPIDVPGEEESPFVDDETPSENVREEAGIVPETVHASEEGLTKGETSETFTRPIPVLITPIQLGEFSLEQATLYRELKELEEAKKASAAAYKTRIDRVEARLDELAKIVTEGTLETPIECQWQYYYSQGIKKLVRMDTHEVVDEKTLTAEELQGSFEFQEQQSVAAVEECLGEREEVKEGEELVPGQCPECLFKSGNHSPACSKRTEETYSLCECNECHAEATCIPFTNCTDCKDGKMLPSDVGEYPNVTDDMAAGEDQL